jgi:hypothetical protein
LPCEHNMADPTPVSAKTTVDTSRRPEADSCKALLAKN